MAEKPASATERSYRLTNELTPIGIGSLIVIAVLSIAPFFVFTGAPDSFVLGIPSWVVVLFVIHWIILGLVVVFVREINLVQSTLQELM